MNAKSSTCTEAATKLHCTHKMRDVSELLNFPLSTSLHDIFYKELSCSLHDSLEPFYQLACKIQTAHLASFHHKISEDTVAGI
jgi:hypothetical protein